MNTRPLRPHLHMKLPRAMKIHKRVLKDHQKMAEWEWSLWSQQCQCELGRDKLGWDRQQERRSDEVFPVPFAGEIAVGETGQPLLSQSSQQSAGVWGLPAGRENQTNIHIASNRTRSVTKETKDAKGCLGGLMT